MSAKLACLAGATVYRMMESGQLAARELPRADTPFGQSQPIFQVEGVPVPFYLMPRHGPGRQRPAPCQINQRANLYALKGLGVQCVLSWSAAGAITHNLAVGQVVLPNDLIDMTRHRPTTFFETSCLGFLRQFPVFCPDLQAAAAEVMEEMHLTHLVGGTAAVTDGPRLETPAEVRMLGIAGAQVVTHTLAPEVFLAKELQLCFAGACYLVGYAETGSRHRPFSTGDLFAGITQASQDERLKLAVRSLPELLTRLARKLDSAETRCECPHSMAERIRESDMPEDWQEWFK